MPQSGFTPIQLYRSSTPAAVATAGNLADGELFINLVDEKLYMKNSAGTVKLLASTAISTGTVTSVAASGGTTGLSFTGSPITSSGTLTLTGTLNVANGGTGATTAATARTNLAAAGSGAVTGSGLTMTTARILGRSTAATGAIEEITIGANLTLSGGVLSATGGGGGGGTVTSVDVSGGTTGLTATGGPITTSGTITLGGTLAIANGGTGAATAAAARTALGAAASGLATASGLTVNTNRLLGRDTAGTGALEEITIGSGLTLTGLSLSANATGTVTSVAASGGTTGLSFTGSPITSSGTLTLTGTLAVANGGTGGTTSTGSGAVVLSASPTFSGVVSFADGTAAAPSITFGLDPNTGFFRVGADQIGVTAGGAQRFSFGTGNHASTVPIAITPPASVNDPSIYAAGAPGTGVHITTTGMRFLSSNTIIFSYGTSAVTFNQAATAAAGLDVIGESRCDTLRIDQTASASTTARTHSVPVNINGTTYYLMLSATP